MKRDVSQLNNQYTYTLVHRVLKSFQLFADPTTQECVSSGDDNALDKPENKPFKDFLGSHEEGKEGIKLPPGKVQDVTTFLALEAQTQFCTAFEVLLFCKIVHCNNLFTYYKWKLADCVCTVQHPFMMTFKFRHLCILHSWPTGYLWLCGLVNVKLNMFVVNKNLQLQTYIETLGCCVFFRCPMR